MKIDTRDKYVWPDDLEIPEVLSIWEDMEFTASQQYMVNAFVEDKTGMQEQDILSSKGINTLNALEDNILESIDEYKKAPGKFSDKQLNRIFHKIQIWGGKGGRNVYYMEPKLCNMKDFSSFYREFVSECIKEDEIDRSTITWALGLVLRLMQIPNLGEVFATKHLYFWLRDKKGDALPPLDNIIATKLCNIGNRRILKILPAYWDYIYEKSKELERPMKCIERELYKHYNA